MRRDPTLAHLSEHVLLTDGGLETWLIFHRGIDLPDFAAYPLLDTADGRQVLRDYFTPYFETARATGFGFVIGTPTWRTNPDWGARLGHDAAALDAYNRLAVEEAARVREDAALDAPVVISGCLGPRGDGYVVETLMTPDEAREYHRAQIASFAATEADLVTAMTITSVEEATGLVLAARDEGMPIVLSFTVETDGRLPSGTSLADAVTDVDAATDGYAAYFMVNCAHPTHFADVLDPDGTWTRRVRAVRANASMRSHAELDEAPDLDEGDPADLAARTRILRDELPWLSIFGGCCGTDERHLDAMARALTASA
jgi:S-methylmethionine-dependent homocysteine/selenocysteine methylase